jgi:hypothetical protein
MYKLTEGGVIWNGAFIPEDAGNRHWQEYQQWLALGNEPEPADEPTPEQVARDVEVQQAPLTARQYFAEHPTAINFIRLTPEQQESQINSMTLAQMKEVVKFLAIAVSALVKERYL